MAEGDMGERWRGRVERVPGWGWTLAVSSVVLMAALAPRLVGLTGVTPGFSETEATNALFAQQINRDTLPIFFGGETDASGPLFPYLVRATGTLTGWGVAGPRLAAVLLGAAAAVACALWYSRALGRWWGLVGGILVATSFWQVLFSTQALAPIATTLAVGLGLWCLWEGLRQPDAGRFGLSLWYPAAGVAFALGFYAHIGYLIIPAMVLAATGYLIFAFRRENRDLDARGGAVMLGVMVLVMTPLAGYYIENPDDFRRDVEQAGELPELLSSTRDDYLRALEVVTWRGPDSAELNLPGRALLDPIVVIWGVLGVAVALRYPLRPLHGLALIWLLLLLMPIALTNPDDPALYLPLAPVLFAFPLIGMRWLAGFLSSRDTALQMAAVTVIAISVLVSAAWSTYDYFWLWADDARTYEAMRGDVRDSIEMVKALPDDDIPAYISAENAGRIVRYLAPDDRAIRLISDRSLLPMPAVDQAYLAFGISTAPELTLQRYLAEPDRLEVVDGPDGDPAAWLWILDERTRERLPYSVPATWFPNGYGLPGYAIQPDLSSSPDDPRVDIALLWSVPGDADPAIARVRLDPPDGELPRPPTTGDIRVTPWKNNPPGYDELILVHLRLPFPQTPDMTAGLLVALADPRTGPLAPTSPGGDVHDEVYVFLNRIGFQAE